MDRDSLRILLVEDNPGDARLLQELMAEAGSAHFILTQVDQLSTGLERLAEGDFDVTLLDLSLPDSQGVETLLRLRAVMPDMPVVVLTGLNDEALGVQLIQAGAQDYLVKGQVSGPLLLRSARYAVERKRVEETLQGGIQELKIAHEQATIYARELRVEIAERKRAEEQIRQNAAQAEALARVAGRLNAQLDLETVLNTVSEEAARALKVSAAAVRLYDEQHDVLSYASAFGLGPDYHKYIRPSPRTLYDELFRQQGTFIVAKDVQAISNVPNANLYVALNIRTVVSVGMERDKQLIGILSIYTVGEERSFTDDELTLLKGLADQAAQAIANARLFAETERRANEFAALYETVYDLATQQNLPALLETVVQRAMELVAAPGGAIFLYDAKQQELEVAVIKSFPRPVGTRMQLSEGMAGRVAQTRDPLIVNDYSTWEHRSPQFEGTSAIVGVPMLFRGELIGVLAAVAFNTTTRKFTEVDARLLTLFAGQAASAVHNARLLDAVQQELAERKRAESALEEERALLAQRVAERTTELRAANAELARAARAKDEFLASMSHELRTPLNAILGLSEVLLEQISGPLNERQLKSLHTIEASGRHLLALINDILDLSKIEAGKLDLQLDPVSAEEVCQASLQFIKEAATRKKISVSFTIDHTEASMRADVRRLKQILVNLLSNAVKFTPEGKQIGLAVTGETEQEVIHFTVWDTGIGISAEDLSRLFKPFVQVDSSLSRQHEGTGLGLALVSRLVELHGGSMSVKSKVGSGSQFTVSLPWPGASETSQKAKLAKMTPARQKIDSSIRPGIRAGEPPLILLAEDNQANIHLLTDYLGGEGYRIVVAYNGVEVIERAAEERPALILMDIQMPGMNGLEAIRRLRTEGHLAAVPIIALTALAMPDDRERCLAAGANDYLSKPVSLRKLTSMIETYLETTQA